MLAQWRQMFGLAVLMPMLMSFAACSSETVSKATADAATVAAGPTSGPLSRPLRGDGGTSAFYEYDYQLLSQPGVLLREEPLQPHQSVPGAIENIRILYSSTDGIDGHTAIAVSGSLLLPAGSPPEDGWPLLLWSHGTVGIADVCAPTWTGYRQVHLDYLKRWLEQGYAIVTSDYQGLGTAGTHPYLATRPASYSNLDVIRAVQNSPYPLSDRVVLVGQSQGAAAAFATAGYFPQYAPELDIRAVVATGIPYFTPETLIHLAKTRPRDVVDPMLGYNLTAMTLIEQMRPDFDFTEYVSPAAMPTFQEIETACYQQIKVRIAERQLTYNKTFLTPPDEPLAVAFAQMGYPSLALTVSAFIGSAAQDRDTPLRMQAGLVKRACAAGAAVQAQVYENEDHVSVLAPSMVDSLPFVAAAFSGQTNAGNCDSLPF